MASSKEQQATVKATLKAVEHDYKTTVREAEKKCNNLRKEADRVYDREKDEIRAKKDKADKDAKDEYQQVKHEASEINIKAVMDIVKNVILDIKSRNLELLSNNSHGHKIGRSNSTSSSASFASGSVGCGSSAKEDAEIREWVEYAAEKLEAHMSKSQARQRLLEEIAAGALIRQYQSQQEAQRKTDDLQRQLQQLQLLHDQQQQQHLHQHERKHQEHIAGMALVQGDVAPPAYVSEPGSTSIDGNDYSKYSGSKK